MDLDIFVREVSSTGDTTYKGLVPWGMGSTRGYFHACLDLQVVSSTGDRIYKKLVAQKQNLIPILCV